MATEKFEQGKPVDHTTMVLRTGEATVSRGEEPRKSGDWMWGSHPDHDKAAEEVSDSLSAEESKKLLDSLAEGTAKPKLTPKRIENAPKGPDKKSAAKSEEANASDDSGPEGGHEV